MIFTNENELKRRVEELTGRKIYGRPEVREDTTQYMAIYGGMVLRLDGNDYFITGDATEGRFGVEDQPKFWVKYAVDIRSGEKKIIKLVFREDFTSRIGPILIRGSRDPEKEARLLKLAGDRANLMTGRAVSDSAGNLVRIIDFIRGPNLYRYLNELTTDHETYYHQIMPGIIPRLLESFEAIAFIMQNGEHHGDIRSDHIIIEESSGKFVWIDYDFRISHADYDVWCLGNVLAFVVGMRHHTFKDVVERPDSYPVKSKKLTLSPEDSLLLYKNRIANLKKLFPYISERLNRILLSFSIGTSHCYDSPEELIQDIREAI